VINRGNNRAERFHTPADFDAFVHLMAEAADRFPLAVLGACLMPNHTHLVVMPGTDDQLPRWMHWLFTTYSRRYHRKYGTSGRVWENRYKAFPIQGDAHLHIVLRYVERNALRANLTPSAERWDWSSLNWRNSSNPPLTLAACPVALPADWTELVNQPLTEDELAALRNCVNRQRPFGEEQWVTRTAADLCLGQSLSSLGRPKRSSSASQNNEACPR
jgi:putative transposase